jgi:hypothetical protein
VSSRSSRFRGPASCRSGRSVPAHARHMPAPVRGQRRRRAPNRRASSPHDTSVAGRENPPTCRRLKMKKPSRPTQGRRAMLRGTTLLPHWRPMQFPTRQARRPRHAEGNRESVSPRGAWGRDNGRYPAAATCPGLRTLTAAAPRRVRSRRAGSHQPPALCSATYCSCSAQMSYLTGRRWWSRGDSNP